MSILKKYMELEGIAELRQFFIAKNTIREYAKNEFFMQRGQKHNHVGFILKGGFRFWATPLKGKSRL
jgi:hypothetical protein